MQEVLELLEKLALKIELLERQKVNQDLQDEYGKYSTNYTKYSYKDTIDFYEMQDIKSKILKLKEMSKNEVKSVEPIAVSVPVV